MTIRTIARVVFAAVAIGSMACGSTEPVSNSANSSNSKASGTTNQTASVTNANEVNDPNAAVANAESPANKMMQRIEQIRAEAANKPKDPDAGKITRAGAEDSVITTQLTDYARETRVFKKHPVLLSVEKIHDGKEGIVNITLRDGRKAQLPGSAVLNIESTTASQILQAAGFSESGVDQNAPTKDQGKKAN